MSPAPKTRLLAETIGTREPDAQTAETRELYVADPAAPLGERWPPLGGHDFTWLKWPGEHTERIDP